MKYRRVNPLLIRSLCTLALVLALPLALVVTSLLTAEGKGLHQQVTTTDWPTYLNNMQRTAATNDTNISTSNAGQLIKLWSFKTGDTIASSPTVVGGTVYVGSWDGYEYALDATTGAQKWKTSLGVTRPSTICNPATGAGVSSSATVQNGVVYVGGGDSNWYALDATTGAVLWKVFTGDNSVNGGHYNWSSPLIYNGYAYIGIASFGDCPLVQGQLLQVSLSTHQIVNTLNLVPTGQVGGGIWTTPSIDTTTNTIYVATGTENYTTQTYAQAVVAVDASTLAVKDSWKLPESEAVLDSDFGTTPTLFSDSAGNQLVAAINKNGAAYAFKRGSLAAGPIWKQQIAVGGECAVPCGLSSVSSGAFGNGMLYMAGDDTMINGVGYPGSVRALDPATGNLLWQHGTVGPVIGALAYTNGLVIDGAGATLEVLNASTGTRLYSYTTGGWLYAAPSVSSGQIFTGGVDGSVYAFGLPSTAPPPPPPDPNCPSGWTCQDIGNPTPAGSESISGSVWTVNAGGAGIRGTSDQFRLMTQSVSGDTQISAKVVSQQVTSGPAQAGLMVRQNNDPAAPNYSVFLTKGTGVVVQYRLAFGGATTTDVQMTTAAPPLYLEIQRVGDRLQSATSNDGVNYTLVPGSTVTLAMPNAVMVGLAVSSDNNGTLSAVGYDAVAIGSPNTSPPPPPPPTPCPTGWSCQDVGNPALVGDQSLSGGTWTLQGAGTDIGGYSDQFHYVWQSLAADGTISARVASQTNTSTVAKAGVMLRQNTSASSPYYAALVTPGSGIDIQYRSNQAPDTTLLVNSNGTVPAYLEVARSGNNFSAYSSNDGVTWTYVIGTSVTMNISGTMLAGLAVTSNNTTTLGKATFDTVKVSTTAPPPPTVCPTGWTCADIGNPTPAGNQAVNGGTWTVQAGGGDIWNTVDQFHYAWQSLAADGSVSAHVTSQTNTDPWAKAGVMLRQTTDPGSPNYAVFVTPGNGIQVQYRATQGANAVVAASIAGTVPAYLKVSRSGTTFSAYTSTDGTTWTPIAGSSVTISMTGTVLAGLAATSHNTAALSTVAFDTVNVNTSPTTCPGGWNCADIGNATPAGSQSLSGGTWTVQAGGGDIWGTSDQFHYAWQSLTSGGSVSAHVTSQTNTDPWAKAGVMLRQTTDPGSPYYAVFVTPSNGIQVQYRATQGANAVTAASITGTVPAYLKVAYSGTTFSAYTSTDGVTWTPIAGSSVTINMTGTVLAGLAATSHNTTALSTVGFDTVSVSSTAPPPPTSCPTGWSCADIGNATPVGGQSLSGGTWTVQAGGGDIWGTSDQFHYAWQSLASGGSVSAHVTSQTNTDPWAQAGVMLRQTTDPGSAYYAIFVTPGNGINVQYRATQGANAVTAASIAGTVPAYLKVSRSGTTFSAYTSTDGTTWTLVAGSTVTLGMNGTVLEGLAATSHNTMASCTVVFDTVSTT